MNKSELAARVALKTDLSVAQANKAVSAVFDSIATAMGEGDGVALVGFGSFSVQQRAERMGKNPATGEQITIPAALVPKFKAGKKLKEIVNK